jgi:hypothetical protein
MHRLTHAAPDRSCHGRSPERCSSGQRRPPVHRWPVASLGGRRSAGRRDESTSSVDGRTPEQPQRSAINHTVTCANLHRARATIAPTMERCARGTADSCRDCWMRLEPLENVRDNDPTASRGVCRRRWCAGSPRWSAATWVCDRRRLRRCGRVAAARHDVRDGPTPRASRTVDRRRRMESAAVRHRGCTARAWRLHRASARRRNPGRPAAV